MITCGSSVAYAFPMLSPQACPTLSRCVFLGNHLEHKGYRCLDLSSRKVIISHHVAFDETNFPYFFVDSQHPSPAPSYPLRDPASRISSVQVHLHLCPPTLDCCSMARHSIAAWPVSFCTSHCRARPLLHHDHAHTARLLVPTCEAHPRVHVLHDASRNRIHHTTSSELVAYSDAD